MRCGGTVRLSHEWQEMAQTGDFIMETLITEAVGGEFDDQVFCGSERPPTERTLARVCREAVATVRCNTKLRYLNIVVSVQDERAIEVVAPTQRTPMGGAPPCKNGESSEVHRTIGGRVVVACWRTGSFGDLDHLPCSGGTYRGKAKVWHFEQFHVVDGAIQTAAISAVGESDPTFPALREVLSPARRQAQPPVESLRSSSSSGRRSVWGKFARRWRMRRPRLSPQRLQ